ncbi:MAG TPA: hypothetical protein VM370_10790 [Candidatus Thermoplasmatota archaeon]|nr:hypothetical protein [Candidatus Thermoplasmatota archaeon]
MRALVLLSLVLLVPVALAGATHEVDVRNSGYTDVESGTPVTSIHVGDTVLWRNLEGHHTITDIDGSASHGGFSAGETASHTFTAPGVTPYRCSFHLNMHGLIVVGP